MLKKNYRINKDFQEVKSAFSDMNGKLIQKMLPFGWGLDNYKGMRRRAILRIYVGSKLYKFKVAMFSSTSKRYYFHIINVDEGPYKLKFLSTRVAIEDKGNHTEIQETIEYTTKNKSFDRILSLFINMHYALRSAKYKLFFFINQKRSI